MKYPDNWRRGRGGLMRTQSAAILALLVVVACVFVRLKLPAGMMGTMLHTVVLDCMSPTLLHSQSHGLIGQNGGYPYIHGVTYVRLFFASSFFV